LIDPISRQGKARVLNFVRLQSWSHDLLLCGDGGNNFGFTPNHHSSALIGRCNTSYCVSFRCDPIVSFFEDWRMAFLGVISSSKKCRTHLLGERDKRKRSPIECAKNL